MKLRTRLFLWVAAVFAIAFTASFYLEDRVTRTNLNKVRENLLQQLYLLNEKKRVSIEEYLADMLWKIQAEVDAVLQGIAQYELIRKGFDPSLQNLKERTWLHCSSLMITNKWIDFVQNTNEEFLMAQIVINNNELNNTFHFPITKHLHLVAVEDLEKPGHWQGPFFGVSLNISSLYSDKNDYPKEEDQDYYVFFTPQALMNFRVPKETIHGLDLSINLLEPFLKWIPLPDQTFYLQDFLDRVLKAQAFVQEHSDLIPPKHAWEDLIARKEKQNPDQDAVDFECFDFKVGEIEKGDTSSYQEYLEEQVEFYVKEYMEHYNKIGLVWGLSTITASNLFGTLPTSPNSPIGIGMVDLENHCGKALYAESVFHEKPRYDIEAALKQMTTVPDDFVTTHLDVIVLPEDDHVFFGNTLKMKAKEGDQSRTGYLTIGVHGGYVLNSLAKSTHEDALFVSGNRVISVSSPEGQEVRNSPWYHVNVEELLSKESGLITMDGKEYYFLHLAPYKRLDLHFFVFNPKEVEFTFVNAINEGSEEVIRKISMQMRLAAVGGLLFVLLFLSNIAKRITRPITHLAEVTRVVDEGRLDEIDIPETEERKRNDEVAALYHSFFSMVKGLREKEKVRGVLNKVVSKEIAEETLKGNVQLGGEEKRVTVLFADIRHFTELTERMDPKDVIKLINTCMTKVSDIIDRYGGVIDKYVGDEVMALFGAPIEKKDSALNAVKSGLDICRALEAWNEERVRNKLPAIEMGIGIHTGTVVAGNMGAENRLNYTVLGANVNLTSRLCSEAQPMQVLISEETLQEEDVKQNIDVEELEPIKPKGFTKPVPVYAVKSYRN